VIAEHSTFTYHKENRNIMRKLLLFLGLLYCGLGAADAQAGGSSSGDINPRDFPGGDLGAQINAAYSSCTNGGCRIAIPPGQYDVSTPVVIATKGKNASIECAGTNTTLTWTPTAGTMFQFATNGAGIGNGQGSGIKNCNIINARRRTTAVAIQFGVDSTDTTGRTAQGAYLENVSVVGFKTQFDLESQAWNITTTRSMFLNPGAFSVFFNPSAVNAGENIVFVGDTFANSLGVWTPGAVNLGLGSAITTFVASNFDDIEIEAKAGTVNLTHPYFENPGPARSRNLRTTPWIDVAGVMTIVGLTAADDDSATPATQPAIAVEGTLTWIGGTIFGVHPATATVVTNAGGHVWMGGDLDLPAEVPQLVNNSGLPFSNVARVNPQFGTQAVQLFNPSKAGAAHWLDLQETDGTTSFETFLTQLATDDRANPGGFQIAMQRGGISFSPLQFDSTGAHVGFHGTPDAAVNQHFHGNSEFDHLTSGTGMQSVSVVGCSLRAGSIGSTCNNTVTLPVPEADSAYSPVCTANGGTGIWTIGNVNTLTATSFIVPSVSLSATATGGGKVVCTITHE
jgi:hypothetical protein